MPQLVATFILIPLTFLPSVANAASYVIPTDYPTLQALFEARAMQPGDDVEVRADAPGGSKTYTGIVRVSGNGAPAQPVKVRVRPGDTIILDSQEILTGGSTLYVNANHYVVDGFHVRGAQGPQVYVGHVGSGSERNTDIVVQNMTIFSASSLGPASHQGIMVNRANQVTLRGNHLSTARADLGANDSDCFFAAQTSTLDIDGNTCIIQNTTAHRDPHNDGVQIAGGNGINFPLRSVSNITIRNNHIHHTSGRLLYKQCIYVEYEVFGFIEIYNNVCTDTVDAGSNIISIFNKAFGTQGTVGIYNNSIYIDGLVASAITTDEHVPNPKIKNNIALWKGSNDYQTCISALSPELTPADINHNHCYKIGGTKLQNRAGTAFKSWQDWQALGFDAQGLQADPQFKKVDTFPYDLSLMKSSSAINRAASLSHFSTDIRGALRPQGGMWDIGAYEYSEPSRLPPPGNLRVVR